MTDDDKWLVRSLDGLSERLGKLESEVKSNGSNTNAISASFEAWKTRAEFDRNNLDKRLRSIEAELQATRQESHDALVWVREQERRQRLILKGLTAAGSFATLVGGVAWSLRDRFGLIWSAIWQDK